MNSRIRTQFLATLGFAESKSLENVLQENIIDTIKIKKLCASGRSLPSFKRHLVWKVLLEVYPVFREAWHVTEEQLMEQFDDMRRTYQVLNQIMIPTKEFKRKEQALSPSLSPSSSAFQTASVYAAFNEPNPFFSLAPEMPSVFKDADEECMHKVCLAQVFCSTCTTEAAAYWCFSAFMSLMEPKGCTWGEVVFWYVNEAIRQLNTYDRETYAHFNCIGFEPERVFARWFAGLFAAQLGLSGAQRLIDCVLTQTPEFVISFSLAMLAVLKSKYLQMNSPTEVAALLLNLRDLDVEVIIQRAIQDKSRASFPRPI